MTDTTSTPTPSLQAPVLPGDADRDRSLPMHCKVERRIVWNLLTKLSAAGFEVVAVDDGDETTKCADNMAAMEAIFVVSDCYLYVRKQGRRGKAHNRYIKLVGGNGEDIISDYSADNTDGFEAFMQSFDPCVNW